jgi:hypothetical protein
MRLRDVFMAVFDGRPAQFAYYPIGRHNDDAEAQRYVDFHMLVFDELTGAGGKAIDLGKQLYALRLENPKRIPLELELSDGRARLYRAHDIHAIPRMALEMPVVDLDQGVVKFWKEDRGIRAIVEGANLTYLVLP